MSFIMSLLNASAKDKESRPDVEAINKLKKQLVAVGFAPGEVNYMVKSRMGSKNYSELSREEIKEIKTALNEQLDIAQKCLNLVKEK